MTPDVAREEGHRSKRADGHRWSGEELRFLLYSHDGLGLGHVRRNLSIAAALVRAAPKASILLATSAQHAEDLGVPPDGVDILRIPGIRKVDNHRYAARRLPLPEADLRTIRSALLAAAVESFRPDVLLVDKHPMGVKGELRRALAAHRSRGGRTALGLRDILDRPEVVRREWAPHDITTTLVEHYDRVLVYGVRELFDPVSAYRFPAPIAARTTFCGYVCDSPGLRPIRPAPVEKGPVRPQLLATVGGGEDGSSRIRVFVEAVRGAPWEATVVAGPCGTPGEQRALRRLAKGADVAFHTFLADLPAHIGRADALVCMGGYNTLVEALSSGTPTVCVPRTVPRQEQLLRARAFGRLGLLQVLKPEELEAGRLRDCLAEALTWTRYDVARRARARLGLAGAERAAACLVELARRKTHSPLGVAG
jgi:predicted glycosyltransferase